MYLVSLCYLLIFICSYIYVELAIACLYILCSGLSILHGRTIISHNTNLRLIFVHVPYDFSTRY